MNVRALLIVISVSTVIFSCKKTNVSFEVKTSDLEDAIRLEKFFASHAPQYEDFTLDATAGGTVRLANGTEINFPSNSFRKRDGNITTGSIKIKAKSILEPKTMILANKPTIAANGQMLESFGEIIVFATQGNDTLEMSPATVQRPATVIVPIGTANGQARKEIPMWKGDTTITYTQNGYNHENQSVSVSVSEQYAIVNGMIWDQIAGSGFSDGSKSTFPLDGLNNWRNCDIFYNDPRPKTTVLGYFGDKFNTETGNFAGTHSPSILFFKTKGTNTLINFTQIIMTPAPGKEGFLSYQNSIPVGQEGTFLALSSKNGKFYADMKRVTIPAPQNGKNYVSFDFNFTEVSESQLLNMINQMSTE